MATNKKRFYTVEKSWYWEKDWKDNPNVPEHKGDEEYTYYQEKEHAVEHFNRLREEALEMYKAVCEVNPGMAPQIAYDREYIFEWFYHPAPREITVLTVKIDMDEFADMTTED